LEERITQEEVLGLPQRTAKRLVLVHQRVEERQAARAAGGRIVARRRADHGERPAAQQRVRLLLVERQAALQEHDRRLERLVPGVELVLLHQRLVVALPEEDVLLRQEAADLVPVHVVAEERRRLVAAVFQLTRGVAREHFQKRQAVSRVGG